MLPDTIAQARDDLKNRKYSAVELLQTLQKRIGAAEDKVKAYVHLTDDLALEQAQAADNRIAGGEDAPLLGVPLAIKDNICVRGARTTCASRILDNFVAPYDATATQRLLSAGAVVLGKTNLDEFAMGSSTENSHYQPTRTPWDLARVPGGSSGGSAGAVSAGIGLGALGSDTGGSIRQPASFCGVTGLKPTYGRVSRFGLVAFASSLDQIGPMARSVADAALLLNVIGGKVPLDSTSADVALPDFTQALGRDVKGLRMGIPKEYFTSGIDPEIEGAMRETLRTLEKLGMKQVEVSLPHTQYAVATYYILACAEASSNLSRYDGVKYGFRAENARSLVDMYTKTREEGFGEEVKRRIILGTFVLSSGYYDAYYLKGQKVRALIKKDFDEAFKLCDVIVAPNSPIAPFKLKEKLDDPLQMYLSDIYTISINLAGLPAMSVPCGFTQSGLPIGAQLIGRHFDEETVLNVGHRFQLDTDHHLKRPPL